VDVAQAVDGAQAVDVSLAIDSSLTVDSGLAVELQALDTAGCTVLPAAFAVDTVLPKGCYFAQKSPSIAAAVKLTLSPGVTIIFSADTSLNISTDQVLVAAGTAADPILLTGAQPQRGFWRGVNFSGTLNTNSVLDHVTVEYAGSTKSDSAGAGVKMTADSRGVRASITNTTIRESQGWGLWLGGSAVLGAFGNNTLTRNTLGPANVSSSVVGVLDAASTYQGNDRDQVVVQGQYVSTAATWAALDVPYFLMSGLTVSADWTIAPGTTLIMDKDVSISISGDAGALIANGTAAKPILFTNLAATRGAWQGIDFDGSNNTRNVLSYVTVEYAGSTVSNVDAAALMLIADSHGVQVKISNCTLRQSQGWGLFLSGSAIIPQFSGNTITKNLLGPVKVVSEAAHQLLPTSTYAGNDVDQVAVQANRVQAVTWQAIGVPYVLTGGLHVDLVWTLAPGVTLLMAPAAWISVSGDAAGLYAVGTAVAPILISGTVKAPGSWESIMFDTTVNAANRFDHCIIEYGGGGQAKGQMGMIIAQSDSHGVVLAVTNSTVRYSSQYGIALGHYAQATISGNTYAGNVMGDVYQAP
jgi:hypothetical protein